MHSETSSDLSQAGLHIAIQDIKDELFDTPECDYAIAQLFSQWDQGDKAEQLLDEMLLKWGTSPEVIALKQRGYAEMIASERHADDNEEPINKTQKTAPVELPHIVAA